MAYRTSFLTTLFNKSWTPFSIVEKLRSSSLPNGGLARVTTSPTARVSPVLFVGGLVWESQPLHTPLHMNWDNPSRSVTELDSIWTILLYTPVHFSCILLYTLAYYRILLHTTVYSCILLYTLAYYCILLYTTVYSCILLYTLAYYCILLYTTAYYCILKCNAPVYPLYSSVYFCILYLQEANCTELLSHSITVSPRHQRGVAAFFKDAQKANAIIVLDGAEILLGSTSSE